jgi:hypothetical protein
MGGLAGFRHVVVYVGDGHVLHSASSLGGAGLSPLSWLRQFVLKGVYRPVGCRRKPGSPTRLNPAQ